MSSQPAPQVLIVGAGPVGLVLACELAWRGVRVRIVDQQPEPSQHSKAIGVFPRTLELLEGHGIVEALGRRRVPARGAQLTQAADVSPASTSSGSTATTPASSCSSSPIPSASSWAAFAISASAS